MTTKMKGLLKGLRYISQIFDNANCKEQEMQIGYPTDVKHVAHIGWDGPSVSAPSWMNEFRMTPEFSSAPLSINREAKETPSPKRQPEDFNRTKGTQDSPAQDLPEMTKSSRSRRSAGSPSSFDAATQEVPDIPKQSRRQQSTGVSINSPTKDLSDGTKPIRRHQGPSVSSVGGSDSSSQDPPAIPKQSRRKKSKGLSTGGSTRGSPGGGSRGSPGGGSRGSPGSGSTRSRLKGYTSSTYTSPFSDPGSGSGTVSKNTDPFPTTALKALQLEEGKGYGRIS